jgi:raffinose/stachyose/melibiose transport system permease protein
MTYNRAVPRLRALSTQSFLLLVAFITLAPLAMIWLASLKTNAELTINPLGLPRTWRFSNFIDAWNTAHLDRYFVNSLLTTLPTLAIVLATASLCGYALALLDFRGRTLLFAAFLLGLMLPTISLAVPVYYTVLDYGLLDTRGGLILAEVATALPLAVFIMRSAFLDLPGELREAVLIDGGTELDSFTRVMLPLARPALATVCVLAFLGTWNSFLYPLVLVNSDALRTLPLGLAFMQGRYVTNIVLLAAGTSLTSVPTILIYVIFQRQYIRGIVEGSFK